MSDSKGQPFLFITPTCVMFKPFAAIG